FSYVERGFTADGDSRAVRHAGRSDANRLPTINTQPKTLGASHNHQATPAITPKTWGQWRDQSSRTPRRPASTSIPTAPNNAALHESRCAQSACFSIPTCSAVGAVPDVN